MKIVLKKKWRKLKASASLSVLGQDGLYVERGTGRVMNSDTGKPHRGAVVDQQQADILLASKVAEIEEAVN